MVAFEVVEAADEAVEAGKPVAATDDDLQAESTADTFFTTNPGEVTTTSSFFNGSHMAAVAEEGELRLAPLPPPLAEGEQKLDTSRIGLLQQEAEMRAEHQAQARLTMLNLARALDESHARQRELQAQLQQERDRIASLNGKVEYLEDRLDAATEAEEKRKAEELLKKGFQSGNRLFLNMMLEKSREAYESTIYKEEEDEDEDDGGASPAGGGGASPAGGGGASPAGGGGARRADQGGDPARRSLVSPDHQGASIAGIALMAAGKHGVRPKPAEKRYSIESAGDKVTFIWILKLWLRETQQSKERKAKELEDRRRRELEEEKKRKMQEEIEARVADVLKRSEALAKELDKANDSIEGYKRKVKGFERKIEDMQAEHSERERQLGDTISHLRDQQDEAMREIREKDADIRRLNLDLDDTNARFAKATAEMDIERRKLQDTIRKISTELQEATMLARYMRETMLKNKRDAAASVSPAKFAELICQLEQMRDQLGALRKDYTNLQGDNTELATKLDKNRRRLELERQFLPLIRHARGPLGPKMGVNDICVAAPGSDQGSPELMKKLTKSKSALSPAALKGHTLGPI